jgi:hypothetical protein
LLEEGNSKHSNHKHKTPEIVIDFCLRFFVESLIYIGTDNLRLGGL